MATRPGEGLGRPLAGSFPMLLTLGLALALIVVVVKFAWPDSTRSTQPNEVLVVVPGQESLATMPAETRHVPRIGYLSGFSPESPAPLARPHLESFLEGLRDLGYRDQQNVQIHYRFARGELELLPGLATELIALPVDVIVTSDSQAMQAARDATSEIPLVMTTSGDPVGTGRVASLARPGGNITGLTILAPDLSGKRVQLLRLAIPGVERVGVLWRRAGGSVGDWERLEAAARLEGIDLVSLEIREPSEINGALAKAQAAKVDAILIIPTAVLNSRQMEIAASARELAIPLIGATEEWAEAGALLSYAPSLSDLFRRAAGYVDKILKGSDPALLPIEQPQRYDLVLNLRTAEALGLNLDARIFDLATRLIR